MFPRFVNFKEGAKLTYDMLRNSYFAATLTPYFRVSAFALSLERFLLIELPCLLSGTLFSLIVATWILNLRFPFKVKVDYSIIYSDLLSSFVIFLLLFAIMTKEDARTNRDEPSGY